MKSIYGCFHHNHGYHPIIGVSFLPDGLLEHLLLAWRHRLHNQWIHTWDTKGTVAVLMAIFAQELTQNTSQRTPLDSMT